MAQDLVIQMLIWGERELPIIKLTMFCYCDKLTGKTSCVYYSNICYIELFPKRIT